MPYLAVRPRSRRGALFIYDNQELCVARYGRARFSESAAKDVQHHQRRRKCPNGGLTIHCVLAFRQPLLGIPTFPGVSGARARQGALITNRTMSSTSNRLTARKKDGRGCRSPGYQAERDDCTRPSWLSAAGCECDRTMDRFRSFQATN